ncbi:hypothetical protein HGA88_02495 [Candidatus Roizmanbacteria bacterium]|nr:hypothetical protein [Candidatus Roizmanbacteria bacterium]
MVHSVIKYVEIYLRLFRFGFILSTAYPLSFLIELFVEVGYQGVMLLFINILYGNIHLLGGWNYQEILFFMGLNIITSEIFVATILLSLSDLPNKIRDGNFDFMLLKPINSLFIVSFSRPYFTSFVAMIPGFYLMASSYINLHIPFDMFRIALAGVLLVCGYAIGYSIHVFLISFTFVFQNSRVLSRLADELVWGFKKNPHSIYTGAFRLVFYYLLPVIFLTSVPAHILIKGIEWPLVISGICCAVVILTATIYFWRYMIKRYASASS